MLIKSLTFIKKHFYKVVFVFTGLVSLIWFLVRVIPKPSRAEYPCQKAAFPIASAFMLWAISAISSITIAQKARRFFMQSKYRLALGFSIIAALSVLITFSFQPAVNAVANVIAQNDVEPVQRFTPDILDELPAKVAMVQSSKSNVDNLTYSDIATMVQQAVEAAGGLNDIINDGDVVVLKPNMLKPPTNTSDLPFNGVVTDVNVLKAVAKMVRALNPNGTILLMEGTAAQSTADYFDHCGWSDIAEIDEFIAFEEASGDWHEFDADELTTVSLHDTISRYPDNMKPNNSRELYFNKQYFNADVIISLPCLKNHYQAEVTGAVKNIAQGCTPSTIYGVEGKFGTNDNWANLRNSYLDHTSTWVHKWLHDFYAARPVDFAIMDGLQGVEKGPGGGRGGSNLAATQKNMRLILASKDPVALDAIASLAMQQDPQKVNYLVYLHNDKIGVVDPALIELVSDKTIPTVRKKFDLSNAETGIGVSLFSKTTSTDYQLTATPLSGEVNLKVTNADTDLARLTIWFDNDATKKYIVGSFNDVTIALNDFTITDGKLHVLFEDIYLNRIQKDYTVDINASELVLSDNNWKLYPNPTTEFINIELPDEYQNSQVIIADMQGREVIAHQMQGKHHSLNVSELAHEQYVVRIINNKNIIAAKTLIKQ